MSCSSVSKALRRLVLLLVLLAMAATRTTAAPRKIDCRVMVYHHQCRGVSGRSSRNHLHGLGRARNAELIRLVATYLSDASESRKLKALEHYLSPNRRDAVSDRRAASLLQRLLPTESDYSDEDYLDD
ncbi:uncharacterized protein LOC122390900 [Amphibalanus amphitrite]|uniref:uncharacterized protein LOC122390900 n=1 Tax=Amphibalanus amphitrite TaxID=1232801 RepID=UPI001C927920|nr:uncharacterized protein LOC122390900 [Amphibalanus amphitrite]